MSSLAGRFQGPSEIDLSRLLLFSGQHSGLRGVKASDEPFLIFPAMAQGVDQVEERRGRMRANSPFVVCTGCHLGPGIQSMMSFSFRGNPNEGPVLSPRLAEPHRPRRPRKSWNGREGRRSGRTWCDYGLPRDRIEIRIPGHVIARDYCASTRRPRFVRVGRRALAVAPVTSSSAYCSGELATVGWFRWR